MTRWRPSRAGILNIWRFHDETFGFHDGRLLLKGPNGSGKSKALEMLLPHLFDAKLPDTMHWNLMGEGDGVRAGFVWLEFQRDNEWFTCGARLQASMSTTDVQASYFTTGRRVGDLLLVNDAGRPLTRVNLARAIGDSGEVYGSPAGYRAQVRTTLFAGMSEQHYESLVTALGAQWFDPDVLNGALPKPDEQNIEHLERQREKLEQLDDALAVTQTLASRQGRYAHHVLHTTKVKLTTATEQLAELSRTADETEQQYGEQKQALTDVIQSEQRLVHEAGEIEARLSGGQRLVELEKQLAAARTRAENAAKHAAELRARAGEDAELATNAANTAQHAREAADTAKARAREAGMSEEIQNRQVLGATVDARTKQIAQVRKALVQQEISVGVRDRAQAQLEQERADLALAEATETEAQQAFEAAKATFDDDLTAWVLRCRELGVVELTEDPERLRAEVNDAAARAREELSRAEWRLNEDRQAKAGQLAQYTALCEKLAKQVDVPPPAPHTREVDRGTMAGAPLWRLVEFRPLMPLNLCAAIEAALEASGLLDAWITPDGPPHLLHHDTFAEQLLATPAPGASLLDVLVPEGHAVHRVLEGIAFGESAPDHAAAVGADGTWRLGSLRGRWAKTEPTYIGVAARELAAQRRIARLTTVIDQLQSDVDELDDTQHRIAARREALAGELADQPGHGAVAEASELHAKAQVRSAALRDAVARTAQYCDHAETQVAQAMRVLDAATTEHELPTTDHELDDVLDALIAFRAAADRWLDERREADTADQVATTAKSRAATSRAHADEAERTAQLQTQEEEELGAELGTATNREDLDRLRARRQEITTELEELREQRSTLERLVGTLAEQCEANAEKHRAATAAIDAADKRLQHLTSGHLPDDAVAHEPGPDAERLLINAVQDARLLLSSRVQLSMEPDEDTTVLTVTLDKKRVSPAALVEWVREQRDQLHEQIAASELADNTDTHERIAERTRAVEELTDFMNQRLEQHRVRLGADLVVQVDRGNGWQPLTKRIRGALSAGEKAMVRHLPRIAVVAALYRAAPDGPRLITLDDVFAGLDDANRGRLLELLVTFDLDVVLTSDQEYCDFRELPGIAIHQLISGYDGDDAVTSVRFTWNGKP